MPTPNPSHRLAAERVLASIRARQQAEKTVTLDTDIKKALLEQKAPLSSYHRDPQVSPKAALLLRHLTLARAQMRWPR